MFKKEIVKLKEKIVLLLEKIHLKIFGHEMSYTMRKFLINLSFVSVGMLLSSALIFLVHLVAARFLGVKIYGEFQVIYTIAQFILIPMLFGLNTAVIKYLSIAKTPNEKNKIKKVGTLLFSGVAMITIIVSFIFEGVWSRLFGVNLIIFREAIVLAFFAGLYFFTRAILQGMQKMKFLAGLEFFYAVSLIFVFGMFIFLGNRNVQSIYIAFIVGYGLFALVVILRNKILTYLIWHRKVDWKISKKIIAYAKYAILGSISGILLSNVDKIVLTRVDSFVEVGLYSVYLTASTVFFGQLVAIFITVFFAQASSLDNKQPILRKINKILPSIFFIIVLLSNIVIYIVFMIVGKKYHINFWYSLLFSINAGLLVVYQIKMWLLNSEGVRGVKKTIQGTLFAGVLNFILNLIFIPQYGIYGAIGSTIFSNVILYLYFTNQLNKIFLYENE